MGQQDLLPGWIKVGLADPLVATAARDLSGIATDDAYLELRSNLPGDVRRCLDRARLEYSMRPGVALSKKGLPELAVLGAAPPEVLDIPISRILLSERTANAVRASGLVTVADVVALGTDRAIKLRGLGKAGIADLFNSIRSIALRELQLDDERVFGRSFVKHLLASLDLLSPRTKQVLMARLGVYGPPQTLEAIGQRLGVTRERIRQVEAKGLETIRLSDRWPTDFEHAVRTLLDIRSEPAYCIFLAAEDPRFEGLDSNPRLLDRFLESFCSETVRCITANERQVVCRLTQNDYDALVREVLALLRMSAARHPTNAEVELTIEAAALNVGARELTSAIFAQISDQLHFATPPGSSDRVLVAIGRSVDALVEAVLIESDVPLHYSEVWARVMQRADADLRRVHNSLERFYLLGRGTYGLWRHVQVSADDVEEVVSAVEDLILSGVPGRQWHALEILEAMPFDSSARLQDLDHYKINAVLTKSHRLEYLGRMVWVAKGTNQKTTADRIDIAQACAMFVREAGHPLSTDELIDKLKGWRGVGRHFQLHNTPELLLVAPRMWGLRERDIPFGADNVPLVLSLLHSRLAELQTGLHFSEIEQEIGPLCPPTLTGLSGYAVMALAVEDPRFKFGYGGYVGLAGWETCRRLSYSEAARRLAQEEGLKATLDELHRRMRNLTRRPVSKTEVTYALRAAGFVYESEAQVWVAPSEAPSDEQQTVA